MRLDITNNIVITNNFLAMTLERFSIRISHSPQVLLSAIYYTVIRIIIVFSPLYLIMVILKITKSGDFLLPKAPISYFIIIASFFAPLIFVLIFPDYSGHHEHLFPVFASEELTFMAPASILTGCLFLKEKNKHLIRLIFFIMLTLLSLFAVSGYNLLSPKYLPIKYLTQCKQEYPLPPGNYDLDLPPEKNEFSIKYLFNDFLSQLISHPITQDKIVNINVFNKSLNNFKVYGGQLNQNTTEDEIIIFFGPQAAYLTSIYTGRATLGIQNLTELKQLLKPIWQLGKSPKIALLVPIGCQIDFVMNIPNIDKNSIDIKHIPKTTYQFIHFKLAVKKG
jgi:hypothetical protein